MQPGRVNMKKCHLILLWQNNSQTHFLQDINLDSSDYRVDFRVTTESFIFQGSESYTRKFALEEPVLAS